MDMRKFAAVLMALVMMFALTACGAQPAESAGEVSVQANGFVHGRWDNGVYSNEFLNMTFTPGQNFSMLPDSDLAPMVMQISPKQLASANVFDFVDRVVEVVALGSNQSDELWINVEQGACTDERIEARMQGTLDRLNRRYGSACMDGGRFEVELGGQTFTAQKFDARNGSGDVNKSEYVLMRSAGEHTCIVALSTTENGISLDEVAGMFGTVETI